MQQVLDRLMLSSLSEANDPFFLEHHRVQAILYFGDGGMFSQEYKLYHRPVESGDGHLENNELRDGIEFLHESLRAGRRVLAVGPTGATIVAAYLSEMGFSDAQALQLISTEGVPKPDSEILNAHAKELKKRSTTSVHG
ncbi:hypothetical protein KQI84_16650 [bacterium]|nr:hypothetical protein [bacterium]